jgi:tubulin---tyrosine ligase
LIFNPKREGYIRTSSERFELAEEKLNDPFIHLTNNAIQKNSEKYGKYEMGNQISFRQFDVISLFVFIIIVIEFW